jgi:histone H3/H4
METSSEFWRKCSVCKKNIAFKAPYYTCSVSTCNGQRTGYVFCSIACFEIHLPGARHRDAGAVENRAPATAEAAQAQTNADQPAQQPKRMMATATQSAASSTNKNSIPREILVVVSKVKDYIRARSEMNTSDAIMPLLSDILRQVCDDAIDSARAEGRKTVLDRDFNKGDRK